MLPYFSFLFQQEICFDFFFFFNLVKQVVYNLAFIIMIYDYGANDIEYLHFSM